MQESRDDMEKINEIIARIQNNQDVRQNVLLLKNRCKEDQNIVIESQVLIPLLDHEDPKVRKNTVMICRYLDLEDMASLLVSKFLKEENWIVKSEMMETLLLFDLESNDLDKLKVYFDQMVSVKREPMVHIDTMLTKLFTLLRQSGLIAYPVFKKIPAQTTVLLTTLKGHAPFVLDKLTTKAKKENSMGVLARIDDLEEIEKIRSYQDIYFVLSGFKNISFDVEDLSKALYQSNLLSLLDAIHGEGYRYGFRIDRQQVKESLLKNDDLRKIGFALQDLSHGRLFNTVSDYDIELRLIASKQGYCKAFLKLYTRQDKRFSYRQYTLPTSMQPYVAASLMDRIRPYMASHARVIDLCCGTGTLLIERNKWHSCRFTMGLDIYGEAIQMARQNTKKANVDIQYVQRDFNTFHHVHQFDEIYGNLPIQTQNKTRQDIEELYKQFLEKAIELSNKHTHIFIHTSEINLLKKALRFYKNVLVVEEEILLKIKKAESCLFILSLHS